MGRLGQILNIIKQLKAPPVWKLTKGNPKVEEDCFSSDHFHYIRHVMGCLGDRTTRQCPPCLFLKSAEVLVRKLLSEYLRAVVSNVFQQKAGKVPFGCEVGWH